jgi:hypothetical protein
MNNNKSKCILILLAPSLMVLLMFFFNPLKAQKIVNYLNNGGLQQLGEFAHPMNNVHLQTSYFVDNGDYVDVRIVYDNASTNLRLIKGVFPFYIDKIIVLRDTDLFPAFWATQTMKNIVIKLIKNSDQTKKSEFERAFQKTISEWNGVQLSMFILNTNIISN